MANSSYKKWNQSDLDYILNNSSLLDKDLALKLTELTGTEVSEAMIRRQRRKMGIVKKRGRPPRSRVNPAPVNLN
jgi:hypothetical protein